MSRPLLRTVLAVLLGFAAVSSSAQVDTLTSYIQFSQYSGTADSIYLEHSRSYGLFVKDSCTSTDYGTTILTGNACWQRIHNNFHPRFWAFGSASPHWTIGTVETEVEAINCAAWAAWNAGGDTIEIDSMYTIDRAVLLLERNTYLGMSDSAGFIRAEPPKTVLTDTAQVGDQLIAVANNAGFRTLQRINIASAQSYDSTAGYVSYTAGVNPILTGDSLIYLSGLNMQETMFPGDSVSLFFPMMKNVSWSGSDSVHLKNLVFDGRRSSYTLNYDWRVNSTILWPTNTGSSLERCRFYNMPAENVVLCGTRVVDCSGTGFNGSALHFSCSPAGSRTSVLYNQFQQLNQVGDSVMEHSEGGFTFSSKVRNFNIAYNVLSEVQEHGIGLFGNDDTNNVITDNLLEAAGNTVGFLPFYQYGSTNVVYNNKNPKQANQATDPCLLREPEFRVPKPCAATSSMRKPMQVGDELTIEIDSLHARNSNENYVKTIRPLFNNSYFQLSDVSINPSVLAPGHSWTYHSSGELVFDNGHRNGISGAGNWGYEPCGIPGGCTDLEFTFTLEALPMCTDSIACPLTGFEVVYDGEVGTWSEPVYCNNTAYLFDPDRLGMPVVKGLEDCEPVTVANAPKLPNEPKQVDFKTLMVNDGVEVVQRFEVYSVVGQWLGSVEVNGSSDPIELNHLAPGVYFLRGRKGAHRINVN